MGKILGVVRKYEVEIGRLGLGFVLIYAGAWSLFTPEDWIGFVPTAVEVAVSRETFLAFHAVLELAAGAALLVGVGAFWGAVFGAANMAGILIATGVDLITFRDVGLLALALMLAARLAPRPE
ncbi:MAG: DoxX family membrane protein [Candidatus Liptonbacteria bacterium]|nr:DoxX family membrane protein [Candidatus Liptonbacteria bacterium]